MTRASDSFVSRWTRILLITAAAGLLVWATPEGRFRMPVLLIALGLPLVFRLVPRNWMFGMRTPRTLWTTEEIWYRQNVITGVVMVVGGLGWLIVLAVRG